MRPRPVAIWLASTALLWPLAPAAAATGDPSTLARPAGSAVRPGAEEAVAGGAPRAVQEPGDPVLELTLLEAIELALRHNLSVRVNRIDREVARESVRAARGEFDPTIRAALPQTYRRRTYISSRTLEGAPVITDESLSASFSFDERLPWGTSWSLSWGANRSASNDEFRVFNPALGSSLSFSLTQPLLAGFGERVNRQGIIVAINGQEASGERFREQVQTVVLNTYRAYWELAFQLRDLEVQEAGVALARQQLTRNERLAQIGARPPLEAIQARQQLAQRELSLLRAQNRVEDAGDDLKRQINLEGFRDDAWEVSLVAVDEPRIEAVTADVEAAIATALERDPALRQARIALRDDELQVEVARNETLPDLSLTANLDLTGTGGNEFVRSGGEIVGVMEGGLADALSQVFSGDFRTWSVGLTMTYPLFNRTARAGHAQALLRDRQARLQLADQEQAVEVQVRGDVRNLESLVRQVEAARSARGLAEQQLQAAELQYRLGTGDTFELLQFQNDVIAARTEELRAQIDLGNARAQLEATMGTLLEFLGVELADAGAADAEAAGGSAAGGAPDPDGPGGTIR